MSELIALLPTVLAEGILDRLNRQAAALDEEHRKQQNQHAGRDEHDEQGTHSQRDQRAGRDAQDQQAGQDAHGQQDQQDEYGRQDQRDGYDEHSQRDGYDGWEQQDGHGQQAGPAGRDQHDEHSQRDGYDGREQQGTHGQQTGRDDRDTQAGRDGHGQRDTNDEHGGQDQRGQQAGRDARTRDQLRADLLCDLLLTADPSHADAAAGITATVHVTVPALTLLDHGRDPALLNGLHPIHLQDATELAAAAPSWTRVLTDPITGHVIATNTYRPTASQRAFLLARDPQCRFPGCRRTRRIDHDHTIAWADGGTTSLDNLARFCKTHHTLKHHSAWTVRQLDHGTLQWTSPTGTLYTDQPPPAGPSFTPDRRVAADTATARHNTAEPGGTADTLDPDKDPAPF